MKRQPFAVAHKINNAISWYGTNYSFQRDSVDDYGEPTGEFEVVETVQGIYHSSRKSFVELIGSEAANTKSKANKGIMCMKSDGKLLKQKDFLIVGDLKYEVTAVEPIIYCDVELAREISLEEVLNEA